MDYLSLIRKPIDTELQEFISLFNDSLSHTDGMLETVLDHIRQRAGKRMRPMLILLTAKCFGEVNESTQRAAVGLELLHTASLVHDDVVDESGERRGQKSVNALYDNKSFQQLFLTSLLRVLSLSFHTLLVLVRLSLMVRFFSLRAMGERPSAKRLITRL